VFSSHLLDEVVRVVDDVAMFNQGKLELLMSMEDLRANHQRRIVQLPSPVDTFPALDSLIHTQGEGNEWAVITHGTPDETRQQIEALGAKILEETAPSLNDIFIARVQANQEAAAS
jgi:ABC-type uncharacterized transport system ATPase subunit